MSSQHLLPRVLTMCRACRAPKHDDGSLAPLFLRFAWHMCGTYDKESDTGGSNGSTIRFEAEATDPENNGLGKAKAILDAFYESKKYPGVSRADMYVLCGYVAIETTGGPHIPFRTGRVDYSKEQACRRNGPSGCPFGDGKLNPHGSRLPAADLGPDPDVSSTAPMHVREKPTIDAVRGTFSRMGFDDRETVCLIVLGHQYGRCHAEVSGYEHPWYVFDPAHWNIYENGLGFLSAFTMGATMYKETVNRTGKRQFNNHFGRQREPFMMLPADMALYWCPSFRKHLIFYDRNRRQFKYDAMAAWIKLTELGCTNLVPEITK